MSKKESNSFLHAFTGSQIASLIAVIVSLSALMVSIYEANIMKEQQQLMVSQQKTSVWPYVKGNTLYSFDTLSSIKVVIENKGIGPALIDEIRISINGQSVAGYTEINDKLGETFIGNEYYLSLASLADHVLAPAEKLEVLSIRFPAFPEQMNIVGSMEINYDLCYCSVYNECWKINTRSSEPNCN
jgi:hypothetical protein